MKAHSSLQLPFISFSSNKVSYCICSQEATVSYCVFCGAFQTVGSTAYCRHKNLLLFTATWIKRAKNDFGTIHRTPLAPASCFTAQFTSTAQWVAVAMNHCFPATAPSALGLCQAHSVSLPVSLFLSSTSAMARKESHGSCVFNDKTIHQTERTCRCQVKHHLNLLVMLNGR